MEKETKKEGKRETDRNRNEPCAHYRPLPPYYKPATDFESQIYNATDTYQCFEL